MNAAHRARRAGETVKVRKAKPLRDLTGGLQGNSQQRRKQRRIAARKH